MFDDWEDFGIRIGPIGVGLSGLSKTIRYSRTDTSHLLRIRIDPEVRRDQIKARLIQPGLLEIEWPRRKGEEIPVE
ncbi:MAG TPA: hypothetical protein VNJ11_09595 [Bryobacteraceae bacterium]|nr:hypothetical protein [Bryobacteraceae bacterium]